MKKFVTDIVDKGKKYFWKKDIDSQRERKILNEQMNMIKARVEEIISTKENLIFMNSDAFVSSCVFCTHMLGKAISGKQRWFFA